MSRNQWMILVVLGSAVLLVFGCLGGYALTCLTVDRPYQTPEQMEPIDAATPVISSTPSPPQTATAAARSATPDATRSTSRATTNPSRLTAASLIEKIGSADGYDWHSATYTDRADLCKWLAANERRAMGSSPGWSYYYEALTAFYDTNEPFVLQQKISEIAALAGLMSRY